MAGVDVGQGGGGRRSPNADINMVPFIDLLMVTVAFLLLTAVWSEHAMLESDAQVPGKEACGPDGCGDTDKVLHVHAEGDSFRLVWKQEQTVISEKTIPKAAVETEAGDSTIVTYPTLAAELEKEWAEHGQHRDPSDPKLDRAVLHTADNMPFGEIAAVLDAVASTKRPMRFAGGEDERVAAYNPVFSVR